MQKTRSYKKLARFHNEAAVLLSFFVFYWKQDYWVCSFSAFSCMSNSALANVSFQIQVIKGIIHCIIHFSKCDQFPSFLRIWSQILKKFLMENFIFCAVTRSLSNIHNRSFFAKIFNRFYPIIIFTKHSIIGAW